MASLPAGDVQQQNQVRAVGYDTYHEILAREPKKKNKGAGKSTSHSSMTQAVATPNLGWSYSCWSQLSRLDTDNVCV